MSNKFSEYTRSSAFHLDLSQRMINVLLGECGFTKGDDRMSLATYNALIERGLLERKPTRPTHAGRLVAQLLVEAGFVNQGKDCPLTK